MKLSTLAILNKALKTAQDQPLSLDRELGRSILYRAIVHQLEFANRDHRS